MNSVADTALTNKPRMFTFNNSSYGLDALSFTGDDMKMPIRTLRAFAWRLLNIIGVAAVGTGMVSGAGGDKVFAKQFLQDAANFPTPRMTYNPELQLMINPDTYDIPVFSYSRILKGGKANGEYQVAPLVTTTESPPPPPPTNTVTPGGGPNGPGPTPDSD